MMFPLKYHSYIIIISILSIPVSIDGKWDLERILNQCDDDSCDINKYEEIHSKYQSEEYNKLLYDYITGGMGAILWDHIRDIDHHINPNISPKCIDSLKLVTDSADIGLKWAYQMIASTGKIPELLFKSTLTSLGDYDTCLYLNSDAISGKYCLIDIFPMKVSNVSDNIFQPHKLTVFQYYPFNHGICLPSTCSDSDIEYIIGGSLKKYPFIFKGNMTCDTAISICWKYRLKNLNIHQIISFIFILVVIGTTSYATYYHVICKYFLLDDSCEKNDLLMCLSCWNNMKKLFTKSKNKNSRFVVIDFIKLFTVISGTVAHFMVNVEIPNGYMMIDRHENMNVIFSKTAAQIFMNENALTIFAYLGGFLMFVSLYPLIRVRKLSYSMAIMFRYIHFIPSILCLTACEFIWTFLFSGPFYTKVSKYVLYKCTNNWWRNLFFIQNFYPSLETCAGHMFSMAIDFQLFLFGLFAMFVMSKSMKVGISFCLISSIYSYYIVAYRAIEYETTGTIYTPYPTAIKIVEYLQFIYMKSETYIPSYVLGLICGYSYDRGFRLSIKTKYDHAIYISISIVLQHSSSMINGLANEFNIIPQKYVWLQIIANRILFTSASAMMMMYFLSVPSIFGYRLDQIESSLVAKPSRDANNNIVDKSDIANIGNGKSDIANINEYSFFTGLCRLSYAIFLSNYLLVRYEFSTSRSLLTFDWIPLLRRLIGSMTFCLIFAFTFYCFFIAPFDALNKRYLFKSDKSKNKKE